ncbi:acyl-ACP thioesterase [candidate division KSB1 bacterium]|nr:acyl-ACP thioesterase [candidate division KSB1 bacterium]
MNNILEHRIKIKSFDVGYDGKIKLSFILNHMQEIAGEHAALLGVSIRNLHEKNLAWVLSRYHIIFNDHPKWGDEILIRTWPYAKEKHYSLREFEILDSTDDQLLRATSSWMIIDLSTRKPVRPGDVLPDYPVNPVRMIEDKFGNLPVCDSYENGVRFDVKLNDLDVNGHVNHTVYVEWALESIPVEFRKDHTLREIEIAYRGEAFLKNSIKSYSHYHYDEELKQAAYHHQIIREDDMKELTRTRTLWTP